MSEQQEEDEGCKDFSDIRWPRAPSKRKFEEELEAIGGDIRAKEQELETIKATGSLSLSEELKSLRAEKNASIERRKQIDSELQKLNKDRIPEMRRSLSRLESTLHYRDEGKINEAIRRLEWNMKVQNFRLSEEKKIVAEIDSLRRSKKTLTQYQALKREMDATRDQQRSMREERDRYFRRVTELKQKEEQMKVDSSSRRAKGEQLKRELDSLYESKRQLVADFKKQLGEFKDGREKRRHESFKKRGEEKRAVQAALKCEIEEFESQKQPYEDEICLCSTLIHYLTRFVFNTDLDFTPPGVMVTPADSASSSDSSPVSVCHTTGQACGPAELEDGHYVLLRKPDDDSYVTCSAKHARKQRRSRKPSTVKRITHTPDVISQFLQLNLRAPTSVAEVLALLEQLRTRKMQYEREAEVKSEAELSVTESALYEMSRQASHTESSDDAMESRPGDIVMEQLLQLSQPCLHGDDIDDGIPDKVECAESDRYLNWHQSKDRQAGDLAAFPPLSQSSNLDTSSRSRSEGSDSTIEGACGGVDDAGSTLSSEMQDTFTSVLSSESMNHQNPPHDANVYVWSYGSTQASAGSSSELVHVLQNFGSFPSLASGRGIATEPHIRCAKSGGGGVLATSHASNQASPVCDGGITPDLPLCVSADRENDICDVSQGSDHSTVDSLDSSCPVSKKELFPKHDGLSVSKDSVLDEGCDANSRGVAIEVISTQMSLSSL